MISFTDGGGICAEEIAGALSPSSGEIYGEILEIIESFSEFSDEGCEFGFAVHNNSLLVRIYDGEMYAFVYPIALCDGVDERESLSEIGKYAVREEIPLVFCDVPSECTETLDELFRFTERHGSDDGYTVRVLTELSLIPDIPKVCDGVLSLSPLCEGDIPDYARLCRDAELNKYWGYDVREDAPDAPDGYFYDTARRGMDDGTSLTLAVRREGAFVGEAVIWGFDLNGGASLAFRILPEFQKMGYGGRALALLIRLGEELGLLEMRASVKQENIPSMKLLDRQIVCCFKDENVKFYLHKYSI